MKTQIKIFALAAICSFIQFDLRSQDFSIALFTIDVKNLPLSNDELTELTRVELEMTGKFDVINKYEVTEVCSANGIDPAKCFSSKCMQDAGKLLKAEKVVSGSIQKLSDYIFISYQITDVNTGKIEFTHTEEFQYLPEEIRAMIRITISSLLGIPVNEHVKSSLVREDSFESITNNPDALKVSHGGPRMGLAFVTGQVARTFSAPLAQGGFNKLPVLTTIGYQFEEQYLSSGRFQALLEVLPVISGLDQGMFIPSITMLNGFRDAKTGFEFAMGPTINIMPMAWGYIDSNQTWHLADDWDYYQIDEEGYRTIVENPYPLEKRLDSRGIPALTSGFIFAVGKTFRSGNFNIPVNIWCKPQKTGSFFGATFGFNIMKNVKSGGNSRSLFQSRYPADFKP